MSVADIVSAIAGDLQGHECMDKVNVDVSSIASICRYVYVLFTSRGPLNGKQLMVRVKIRVVGDLLIL